MCIDELEDWRKTSQMKKLTSEDERARRLALFDKARKVGEGLIASGTRGKSRISFYAEAIKNFRDSEVSAAVQAEREQACKDVCVRCRDNEGIYLHPDGKVRHKKCGSVCDAGPIHERGSRNELREG